MTIYHIPPMNYTCPLGTVDLPALELDLGDLFGTSVFLAHLDSYEELGRRLIALRVGHGCNPGGGVHYLCHTLPDEFEEAYKASGFTFTLDNTLIRHGWEVIIQTLDDNGDPIRFAMRNAWCKWMARHIREQDNDR